MTTLQSFREYKKSHFGINRANMPQILAKDVPEFLEWVKEQGVSVKLIKGRISQLTPTQEDRNQEKVDYLVSSGKYKHGTLLVSSDNYIIDGHHRFFAAEQALGKNGIIEFTKIDKPILECLALAHRFPKSFKKELHEMVKTVTVVTNAESKMIAQTILTQIKGIDRNALMAWGAKNYMTTNGNTITPQVVMGPGLQFDVRGGKFKGRIIIGLNANDEYDIAAIKISLNASQLLAGTHLKVYKHVVGIGVENLVSTLDEIIG